MSPNGHLCFGLCLASQLHLEPFLPLLFPLEPHKTLVSFLTVPKPFLPQSPFLGIILISDQRSLTWERSPSPSSLREVLLLQILIALCTFPCYSNHKYVVPNMHLSVICYILQSFLFNILLKKSYPTFKAYLKFNLILDTVSDLPIECDLSLILFFLQNT